MFSRKPIEDLICKLASLQMPNRSQKAREGQEMILSLADGKAARPYLLGGMGFRITAMRTARKEDRIRVLFTKRS